MLRFKQYLIEETQELFLILEGKGQHQLINQFGDKILKRMDTEGWRRYGYDHYNQKGDTEVRSPWENDSQHGTIEHKTEYIMKHLGIPESPSYLDINKPEHVKIWNSHVNWMLKSYANGSEDRGINSIEDITSRALPLLKRFSKLVEDGKLKHESLTKWNHLNTLESAVNNNDPLHETAIDPSEYTKIGENEHWHVVSPHTSNAACTLGHNSKWCTTGEAFADYISRGPLYIAIPKDPQGRFGTREKYQIHYVPGEFKDLTDNELGITDKKLLVQDRPFPMPLTVLEKIHHKAPITDFTNEETEHLIKHHPSVAYRLLPERAWNIDEKLQFLKQDSKLTPQEKKYVVDDTDLDNDTITHILKHTIEPHHQDTHPLPFEHTFDSATTTHILHKYSDTLTPEQLELARKHKSFNIRKAIATHPNLTMGQLGQLQSDISHPVRSAAMQNSNTNTESLIDYVFNTGFPVKPTFQPIWSPTSIKSNPNYPNYDPGSRISEVISHPNFPKHLHHEYMTSSVEDYNKILELPEHQRTDIGRIQLNGLKSPHTTKEHLDNIVNKLAMNLKEPDWKHDALHDAIIAHPLSTSDHLMTLVKNARPAALWNGQPSFRINEAAILSHPKLTPEIFTELVKIQQKNTTRNKYPSKEQITEHPMFTKEHEEMLNKVYDDRDVDIRYKQKGTMQYLMTNPS